MKPRPLYYLLLLALAATLYFLNARRTSLRNVTTPPPPPLADEYLSTWESHYARIPNFSLSCTQRISQQETLPDNGQKTDAIRWQHIDCTAIAPRFHLKLSSTEKPFADPNDTLEEFFDGTTLTHIQAGKTTTLPAQPFHDGNNATAFLNMLFDNLELPAVPFPLHEPSAGRPFLLAQFRDYAHHGRLQPNVTLHPTLELIAGEPCHVLENVNYTKDHREYMHATLWLAASKNCLVMKSEYHTFPGTQTFEVQEIAQVPDTDFWYPTRATRTDTSTPDNRLEYALTVHHFSLTPSEAQLRLTRPPTTSPSPPN